MSQAIEVSGIAFSVTSYLTEKQEASLEVAIEKVIEEKPLNILDTVILNGAELLNVEYKSKFTCNKCSIVAETVLDGLCIECAKISDNIVDEIKVTTDFRIK